MFIETKFAGSYNTNETTEIEEQSTLAHQVVSLENWLDDEISS
jgi:hypothetical protein